MVKPLKSLHIGKVYALLINTTSIGLNFACCSPNIVLGQRNGYKTSYSQRFTCRHGIRVFLRVIIIQFQVIGFSANKRIQKKRHLGCWDCIYLQMGRSCTFVYNVARIFFNSQCSIAHLFTQKLRFSTLHRIPKHGRRVKK